MVAMRRMVGLLLLVAAVALAAVLTGWTRLTSAVAESLEHHNLSESANTAGDQRADAGPAPGG